MDEPTIPAPTTPTRSGRRPARSAGALPSAPLATAHRRKVRRRILSAPELALAAQLGVLAPVAKVDQKADREPDRQANPGAEGQEHHEHQAAYDSQHRYE